MTIHMTARYRVNADALDLCRQAVQEFITYVREYESGTLLYAALSPSEDPAEFLHYCVFRDDAALQTHRDSAAMARLTAQLRPQLVSGGMHYTPLTLLATT